MRNTLRVSPAGLAIVDKARRDLGFTQTALRLCYAACTSQATLKRFFQGRPIQRETFICICKALGIDDWEFIADISDLQSTVPRELSGTLSQPMDSEEMLAFIDDILLKKTGKHINSLSGMILLDVWNGKRSAKIALNNGYNYGYTVDYIKKRAANLSKILSDVLGENIKKFNFRATDRL
jgi:transcriptional regulator with XRE-family HTH domain